jgi:hypothetical protein
MNGRILPFEPRGHDEALRLLPWLVNDSLEPEERGWVDAHVAGCPQCRDERALLEALFAGCQQEGENDAGVDAGWRRMRDCVQPRAAAPSAWRNWRRRWVQTPRWVGWTLATQAALVLVAGMVVWAGLPRPDASPPVYRTLGTAATGSLMVMVDPQMREAQWRDLLQASGARIVDGPNGAGAYVLAVPPERTARACDALRAARGVLLVERIDGGHGCGP